MYLFDDVINDDFLYTEGSIKENLKKQQVEIEK